MQTKTIYRLASLLVVVSLVISTYLVAHAATPATPVQATANFTNLAWFYKPPADGNLALIAQNFSTFIMTKGNESARDQLLAMGAQHPVLEYLRFEAIMDPGSCTATPWNNNVAYKVGDFCDISANHPDWFLLTTSGQRITHMTGTTKFVLMDPGNSGWRAFFLNRVKQIFAADKVWDGVFLDNVEITNSFHVKAGEVLAAYPDNASFQAAVQGFLQYLRTNYFQPNGKLLSANLISRTNDAEFTKYLTYLDSAMHEGWAIDDPNRWRSAATWETHMALAEQTQAMGKSIILVSHGTQNDLELQQFAFASYLLIANGKASFRYASSSMYNQAWLYDNYKIKLGAPLGKRYQSGTAWKRDFSNGSVTVDPNSHAVSINLSTGPTPTTLPPTATPKATQAATATATRVPTQTVPTATPITNPATATSLPPTKTPTAIPATPTAAPVNPTTTPTAIPTINSGTTVTTVYDQTDPGFVYTGTWATVSDNKAANGSYAQTNEANASVSFTFTGTSFSFKYIARQGGGKIKIFVDGIYLHEVNTQASKTRYQKPWVLSDADTLINGVHQLTLVFIGPSGTNVTFDELSVQSPQ
jgi:hypothetical protein